MPFTGDSPTAIMLKHLQESAPSVLAERSDLPDAIDRVVARALEKRPEDRYQTVGELVEDFTIAAGMEPAGVSSTANSVRVEPSPATGQPVNDDEDEETLVRRRITREIEPPVPPVVPSIVTPLPMPPQNASFNPWKVLVPSMIGLLVIFGVIYAFTRNSQPTNATAPGSTLAADPNSQPVEPATPPTGESEAGIPAGGTTNQTANSNNNANTSAAPSPSENPADIGGVNVNANDNANENSNNNKGLVPPLPSPTRQADDAPPQPSPTATKPPLPKPSVPPASASPPALR